MKKHSGRALVRGGAARTLTLVVEMGIGVVLTPFLVHRLGDVRYGAWLVIGSVTGVYGMLDMGLTQAVARHVSRAHGLNDPALARRYVTASFYLFTAIGLLLMVGGAVLAPLGRHMAEGDIAEELPLLFFVTALALGVSFPTRTFMGVLTAHLNYDRLSLTRMGVAVARGALSVWVVLLGHGLLALTLLVAIGDFIRMLILWRLSNAAGEPLVFRREPEFKSDVKDLIHYGSVSFVSQIADMIRSKMSPIIVSQVVSLAAATPYGIANRLAQIYSRSMQALVATSLPVFSRLEAQADPTKYLRPYMLIYKISCYFAIFGAGCVWLWVEPFIVRWIGAEYAGAAAITKILMMGAVCATMQVPAVNLLFGTSQHAFYAKINWLEAILVLVLTFTWGNSHGLIGIAYAYAVSMIVVKLGLQPWGAARVLGLSLLRYHFNTVPSALKALVFTLPMVWLIQPYVVPKYSVIFLGTAACAALFAAYIYWVGFDKDERAKLVNAVYKRKRKAS